MKRTLGFFLFQNDGEDFLFHSSGGDSSHITLGLCNKGVILFPECFEDEVRWDENEACPAFLV